MGMVFHNAVAVRFSPDDDLIKLGDSLEQAQHERFKVLADWEARMIDKVRRPYQRKITSRMSDDGIYSIGVELRFADYAIEEVPKP